MQQAALSYEVFHEQRIISSPLFLNIYIVYIGVDIDASVPLPLPDQSEQAWCEEELCFLKG